MKSALLFSILLPAAPAPAATRSNTAIDAQGNIWRTGQSLPVALTANAFQKTESAGFCAAQQLSPFDPITSLTCAHAFVTKQDASGNVLYATYLGGSSEDGGIAITTDAQGNAYVTGFTYSAGFPVTAGVVQPRNAGPLTPVVVLDSITPFGPAEILPGGDVFVARFAPDGTLLYSTLLGGSGSDVPALIAVDSSGSACVAGTTSSTDFPVTSGGLVGSAPSGNFFARLNPRATSLAWSTYSAPTIQSFDLDAAGDAFLTGSSSSGPYVTKVNISNGNVQFTTLLSTLNAKFRGAGAAIAVNAAGEAWVGVSPAPMASQLLTPSPPVYPLGPSFLLKLSNAGSIRAEVDIGSSQFDSISQDSSGNAYAFGHGTGALPAAPPPPLLAAPCSSAGGEFVIETNAAGAVAAATYLRQTSDSIAAIQVPMNLANPPAMNFGCLQNLASGAVGPGIAPGEIFVLFGSNLGPAQAIAATPGASGRYPASLAGVEVLINGTPAPLLMVQAGEIHGVVPFGYSPGATAQVEYQGQSAPLLDEPTSVNPGIFTINGQGAILNQDGTVNTPSNPAGPGSIVSIYATGTGPLATPISDGQVTPIPPPYILLESPPEVTFAGILENVLWAGSAPGLIAGVTQINVRLPSSLPAGTDLPAVPVVVISPGVFSLPASISVGQ